ncbi:MAG: metal ABC transporter substrate-binding protein [Pseudobdellovibrio sp.]
MKKFILFLLFPILAHAKLNVATTTTDLEALVKQIGQDQVEVFSIAKGTQDPHQIDAKPSFMVKLRNTDLVVEQGLELESAWIDPLIQGSRNSKLNDKNAVLELAGELNPIEKPTGNISRSEGDVHPGGNPHFQLDPIRLGQAATLIAKRMGELDPAKKDFYYKNAESFNKSMIDKTKDWQARIIKSGIKEIVTYHKTFSYFCSRFQIQCNVQLEPKPGIPPTASHILSVIDQMKKRNLHLVLIENLYDDSVKDKLASAAAAKVYRVPVSVGGEPEIKTNEQLIEKLVKVFEENR